MLQTSISLQNLAIIPKEMGSYDSFHFTYTVTEAKDENVFGYRNLPLGFFKALSHLTVV